MKYPFYLLIAHSLFSLLFLLNPHQVQAQCTPVGGVSGIVQSAVGPVSFTAVLSATASNTNLGPFTGVCGISFPSITTPWSGNSAGVNSTVTYNFSVPITGIDVFVGYTGVNGSINPEAFTYTTNGPIPSVTVNSGTCVPWIINGNTVTSPNIVGGLNSYHTISTTTSFTSLTITTNSTNNGGSSYALCDGSIQAGCTPTSSQLTETACDAYTSPSGQVYSMSGIYADTVLNAAGCDSIITIDLTVNTSSAGSETVDTCDSFFWPADSMTYTTGGTYMALLTNAAGCDSTVTLNLTLSAVDTSVTLTGNDLIANATNATFQWLDCEGGYAVIPGATNAIFTASVTGNYAVEVTQNGCVDTSACFVVTPVGIAASNFETQINFWPNPTQRTVNVSLGKKYDFIQVKVLNVVGQMLSGETFSATDRLTLELPYAAGYYLLEINAGEGREVRIPVVKE